MNSSGNEFSPSLVEAKGDTILFFSSDGQGSHDIYSSTRLDNGVWMPARAVTELNSPVDDARPNVRADGLEIVFDSVRGGGPPDIWTAVRPRLGARWREAVKLGPEVNSLSAETRPSISKDGKRLYFGSTREGVLGSADIHMSVRWKADPE